LYVGIDFSKGHTDLALLLEEGPPLVKHKAFANNLSGYQQVKEFVIQAMTKHDLERLDLAGEATSYYWLPLFIQVAQDADLAKYQPRQYLLNPRWIHWYKKSKSPNHKDDSIDPAEIGDYLRERHPQTPWNYDPRWLSLRFYTRLRSHLVKSLTREKNLLNLYLFLACTTYANQGPFSDYLGSVSQKLLQIPDWMTHLQALSVDDLAEELSDLSAHHLHDPVKKATELQKVFAQSYPLDPALTNPIWSGISILLKVIQTLQEQIASCEKPISDLSQSGNYPEIAWLDSIPQFGLVTASGIAAEIGGIQRFSQKQRWDERHGCWRLPTSSEISDAVSKFAGLWWPKNASGQFEAEERRLSREGNAYLRFYVLEAADRLRQHIPSFHDYYTQKYDQATKHKHKRALVLTGTKCLDLVVTLLRRQEFYRAKEGDHTLL
jgi:hypothetical protein